MNSEHTHRRRIRRINYNNRGDLAIRYLFRYNHVFKHTMLFLFPAIIPIWVLNMRVILTIKTTTLRITRAP